MKVDRSLIRRCYLLAFLALATGCGLVPQVGRRPLVHNPFPQLTKVAVAPFFNLSAEPTADGRQFALAYYNELQSVPGFEVIPMGVVEGAMQDNNLTLDGPGDAQRLAQLLKVDAIVVGAVTDYSPYYPPRCGLQIEWYAANPCFCAIPPGYGLPWGTQAEEKIPPSVIFDAKMAMARAQLKHGAQPPCEPETADGAVPASFTSEAASDATTAANPSTGIADGAEATPAPEAVLQLTRLYNGHDLEFTEAMESYYFFRDDARFGGWQSYLGRSEDFIRFCCHLHVQEMLVARGGGGESRVVWRWPTGR